jgi:RNA polymerase sigma factor (TIGR02999 family)
MSFGGEDFQPGDRTAPVGDGYSPEETALAEQLVVENYETLMQIARAKRRRAQLGDTLLTTDLLHESYLKLDGRRLWRSSQHFICAATLAMRHVIVDHARAKLSQKRGQGAAHVSLEDNEHLMPEFPETPEEILAIAELLERLQQEKPRWVRIIDSRYFGGMTETETAALLSLSERTVRRDWREARDWLAAQLGVDDAR